MKISLAIIGLIGLAASAQATIVYDNTLNDTGGTVFYSTGPYTEIGDQIMLVGTQRLGNTATVEFFNDAGTSGTFDATLQFYDLSNVLFGGPILASGNSIASNDVSTVTFGLGGIALPDNLIFTVSVSSQVGVDLGLTVFDPVATGSSDTSFFIVANGGPLTHASQGNSQDNIYFSLDASDVPEPSTIILSLFGIPAIWLLRRRRSRS